MLGNTNITTQPRTFEIVIECDKAWQGVIDDWPPNIQDKVWGALERLKDREEIQLTIIHSEFRDNDHAGDNVKAQYPYVMYIVASEIVIKDVGLEQRIIDVKLATETEH